MKTIGRLIRFHRKFANGLKVKLSQQELGALAFPKLSPRAAQVRISRLELGTIQPSIHELARIEESLRLETGALAEPFKETLFGAPLPQKFRSHIEKLFPSIWHAAAIVNESSKTSSPGLLLAALKTLQTATEDELKRIRELQAQGMTYLSIPEGA